ncbi:TetR/AcrR family transcriptional regulator [Komarekiella sp. 'clone 1']|uniref:TetR/AcrR family transcriptional regulator n=1 Tax=Komarekiella delphini-convector SJRDD-AB1 TaxID=2593771 RepID=A0AA40VRG8_9NOST|nr:TetR/AcrR family transcriptional regulator [Komarekiella delphini-convector]MBD6617187.1 TetR/AcrR family transcriptional regulator [Komarekiella delphini-convector SJRDD-AB1]
MSEPIKSSPGRPRSGRSHQAILKATLDLLGEVGYERMSIEAIATRAEVGKPTIYRRYASKEELVADAIESLREEISIPDTGSFWSDLDLIIESAARTTLTPLNRQLKALIISTASSSPQFAQIYWTKYLQPRRQAFRVVIERAKTRNEVHADTDSDLIFDLISGISLYAQIFHPTSEPWEAYIRRALELFLRR